MLENKVATKVSCRLRFRDPKDRANHSCAVIIKKFQFREFLSRCIDYIHGTSFVLVNALGGPQLGVVAWTMSSVLIKSIGGLSFTRDKYPSPAMYTRCHGDMLLDNAIDFFSPRVAADGRLQAMPSKLLRLSCNKVPLRKN
jgi:hypothetical protein